MINIIGGGVAGLTVGAELTRRGEKVTIFDPKGSPGPHHCSWWAGGMLAPHCESESADPEVVTYGLSAAAWWKGFTSVVEAGSLVVSNPRDKADLNRFERLTREHQRMDRSAIENLEPDLAGRFADALYFPTEAHLSPRKALADLRAYLSKNGALFVDAEAPPGLDAVVDCRGLGARDQLRDLRGVKGEMLMIRSGELNFQRPIRFLHPRIPLYLVPRGEGVYMLGATMIENNSSRTITARSLLEMLSSAYAIHPAFGEAEILETGVDFRPAFLDNLPRVNRKADRYSVNGLFRHGYLLAPALACQLSDWLLNDIKGGLCADDQY